MATTTNKKKYLILRDKENRFRRGNGTKIYRIKALHDIIGLSGELIAREGEIGGWIQNSGNLSQEGSCWVGGEAIVSEEARVLDNAVVDGRACVYGSATVCDRTTVTGDAMISGYVVVKGNSLICDFATIKGQFTLEDCRIEGETILKSKEPKSQFNLNDCLNLQMF